MLIYNALGELRSTLPADDIHEARARGRLDGQRHAGNWSIFEQVVDAGLGCALDYKADPEDRKRAAENVIGFSEGWTEAMAVRPLRFLTRYQTIQVAALPAWVRARWLAAYNNAVMAWIAAGGTASGRAPRLPEIPQPRRG